MSVAGGPRFLPGLLLLFVGSGCAALIYEVVWLQLLQLVIGSSAVSLAVLLGTFMGGMCLGSLGLPRLVGATRHPLRVYAALEFGIALAGVFVLFAVPVLGHAYATLVGHGGAGISLRALVCATCLLPPTILMGATLPAIARWVEATPRGVAWLGAFYGGNTVGAVLGCVLAGFYLLRVHDTAFASWTAIVINLAVGLGALGLAHRSGWQPKPDAQRPAVDIAQHPTPRTPAATASVRAVLVALAISGFCALSAEVVWTRVLSLLLGATVYTFAIILAVFLAGLGLGSSAGATLGRRLRHPAIALVACQWLQVVAVGWAAHTIVTSLPYWAEVDPGAGVAAKFMLDVARCAWAILPSALLWGASFPLGLASAVGATSDSARLVARCYAANTVGAIAGAVATALLFIPALGSKGALVIVISAAVIAGAVVWRPGTPRSLFVTGAVGIVALMVARGVPALPWQFVAYGRQTATTDFGATPLYVGEGMNSSVAVTETPGGARFFHVSGKTEASSLVQDMRLQRLLGHLPALVHPQPRSVLIVGCGAGVTAGSFVLHPSIERIVICDIEPLIPRVVAEYFREQNHNVVRDPRVEIIHDDARHYIATTDEQFDIITSDPIHPWVKGSAVLYSQEYFELVRRRLKPGGLVTQWVPLYESDRAVVQSEIATFFSVFPHGTIWANDLDGFGYDTVMLAPAAPLRIDVDALQRRLDRPDHAPIVEALAGLGFGSAVDLLATYAGRGAELKPWLAGAEINRDRNLRLQYLAGLQLESRRGTDVYDELLQFRRYPADLFQGSASSAVALRTILDAPPRDP